MDMDNSTPQIDFALLGRRLRHLREGQGWTLDELAVRTGLSVSYLSRCESGDRQPSLGTLSILAQVHSVTLAALFEPEDDPCIVVRGDEAPVRPGNDLIYALLSRRSRSSTLQAIRVQVTPQGVAQYQHEGEEWIYVLSGRLYLTVGDEEHMLQPGDAAHFDARVTHRFASALEQITEILVVACTEKHPLMRSYL